MDNITRGPRAFLPIMVAGLLVLWSCGDSPPPSDPPLVSLDETLISAPPLIVAPGTRWQEHGDDRWSFHNRADLLCWVRQADGPLVVRLRPNRITADHHFRFAWDGTDLGEGEVERDAAGWRIKIPPDQLTPGPHRLTLNRDYASDQPAHRGRVKNVFAEIAYRYGDERQSFDLAERPRYELVARFIQHGVAGSAKERRGGILFAGATSHAVTLEHVSPATLYVEPENFSAARAVFNLRAEGVEKSLALEPGERGELAVELPAGPLELRLDVEGDPRGLYLWGMPHLLTAAARRLPPIVLITLDTTRRDALGPYGGTAPTPSLDRLAEESTVFDQAFATAPWTLPSHASMFTGLYPSKHGAGVSEAQLPRGTETLARILRHRGYLTAGFSSGDLSSSRFGLGQGFHTYRDPDRFETLGGPLSEYVSGFVDRYGERPFFLFINYFDAHALYQAPAEYEEKLGVAEKRAAAPDGVIWQELLDGKMSGWSDLVRGAAEVTPEGIAYLRAAYLAEVAWVDHLLGKLFDQLRHAGIWDRALVVVTADHGELLGEGGYFSHAARLDPELVEIPLFVKWPGQKKGERRSRLTSQVDLFPTLLAAAGLEAPASDGQAITPAGARSPHRFVLFEEHESLVHLLPENLKLSQHVFGVQRPDFRQVLWDSSQSCARRSSAGGWQDEPCTAKLEEVLTAIQAQLGQRSYGEVDTTVPEELKESLKALGYL